MNRRRGNMASCIAEGDNKTSGPAVNFRRERARREFKSTECCQAASSKLWPQNSALGRDLPSPSGEEVGPERTKEQSELNSEFDYVC